MFLILAHTDDSTAKLVHAALLKRHASERVRFVAVEDLIRAARWSYRDTGRGVETDFRLPDGSAFSSSDIEAVFNRARFVLMPQFGNSPAADYDYAVMEMRALLLSWLESLGSRVFNRASVRGLAGAERSPYEWLWLAGRAGLPARGLHLTTNSRLFPRRDYKPYRLFPSVGPLTTQAQLEPRRRAALGQSPALFLETVGEERCRVLVVGERIEGAPREGWPDELNQGCLSLARLSGCELVELIFARSDVRMTSGEAGAAGSPREWRLCAADSFPVVRAGSEVEAIVRLIEESARQADEEGVPG